MQLCCSGVARRQSPKTLVAKQYDIYNNLMPMTLSDYAIQQLVPYITGDGCPPRRSGPELVKLFNKFGASVMSHLI